MSNKKNNNNQKESKTYIDLLYMTPEVKSAKDIATLFENDSTVSVQLWEEMNVLELELVNENSIDFEPLEVAFKDPSDAAFVKNRNIKTIFALSLNEAELNNTIPYFEKLIDNFSGFVCADTVDFTPVYAGSSKKPN